MNYKNELIFVECLLAILRTRGIRKFSVKKSRLEKCAQELKSIFKDQNCSFLSIFNRRPITGDYERLIEAIKKMIEYGALEISTFHMQATIVKFYYLDDLEELAKRIELTTDDVDKIYELATRSLV